jgi:hypothetical protein
MLETILNQILPIFGVYIIFVVLGGWLFRVVLIESLKRESERLSSQLKQQMDISLKQLEQQGAKELETTKQKLEIETKLNTELRTEFMAEQAINRLLSTGWKQRSFKAIKERIAGFSDDELQQLLVRAGAVRFRRKEDEEELWGLLSRNTLPNEEGEEAV